MVNKSMKIIGLLALTSFILLACNNSNSGDPKNQKNEVADRKVELVFFSSSADSEQSFDERFGNAIRKKFPNYTIKYIVKQKGSEIKDLMVAGTQIDIVWDSIGLMFGSLIKPGLQFDMSELVKKNNVDLTRFEPTVIDAIHQILKGGIYGLPVMNNNMILWYNKDIFDRFGVPYPKDGMTWDEALALSNKMTRKENGTQYYGLISSPIHYLRMNQLSLPFLDSAGKSTVSNPKWKGIFDTVFKGPSDPADFREQYQKKGNFGSRTDSFLKDKETAMQLWVSSMHSVWPDEMAAMNWDVTTMPVFNEARDIGSQAYPTYFFITSISKHQDEAMEVIKYLISDEHQLALSKQGVVPVVNNENVKKAFNQETKFKDKNFYNALFKLKFAPIPEKTAYDDTVINAMNSEITNIIKGSIDVNTALRNAEEKANANLEAEYKK